MLFTYNLVAATMNFINILSSTYYTKKKCGACERELPEGAYSRKEWSMRQSTNRCKECVAGGNQLVIMRKGRTRSEEDECPICNRPFSHDANLSIFQSCCSKLVCNGCLYRAKLRGMNDCPFCRTAMPKNNASALAMIEKRAEAGDPAGISNLANQYLRGGMGVKQDVPRAAELYERAAELGNKDSHNTLSCIYAVGMMDVKKDMAKAIRHWEKAAMLGHAVCRHNLGSQEYAYGNRDLALQHLMISAKLGYETSLNMIKMMFMNGAATKADYAGALRGYQNAIEEMRSPDRDEAIKGLASNMPKLSWEL